MYLRVYMFESRELNDVGDVIVGRAAHWLALPGVTSHGPPLPGASAEDPVLGQQPQRRHPGTVLFFILFLLDTSCPGIHASATQVSVPAVSPALLARHLCVATRRCILSLPHP